MCYCNQKGGSRKPAEWRDLPRTLVLTLYQSTSNPQTPNLSWLGPSSCHRSPIYLQLEDWQTQQRITRHNTQLWSYITHRCLWGKMLGHHSWIAYIVRERKHCPRTQFFTKQEALIIPPILPFSLSFSLYVHLQQWARPHIKRSGNSRSWPRLLATELFTLLVPPTFSAILLPKQKRPYCQSLPTSLRPLSLPFPMSSAFFQKQTSDLFFEFSCWLPPEACSNFPTPFHSPRSVLSLVTFIIRAPSMPAAMPNFAHTT